MSLAPSGGKDALFVLTGEKTLTTTRTPTYLALSTAEYDVDPGVTPGVAPPTGELAVAGYSRIPIHSAGIWDAGITQADGSVDKKNLLELRFGPFTEVGDDIYSWFITTAPQGTAATEANIKGWGVLPAPRSVLQYLQIVFQPNSITLTYS